MPTYDLPSSFDFDDPRVQVAIEKITKRGTRVSGADVAQSRTLHFIAEWYAARYDGRFDYMRQMHDLIASDRDLSVNQMAGVINCLVHDASKRKPIVNDTKLQECAYCHRMSRCTSTINQDMTHTINVCETPDSFCYAQRSKPSKLETLPADLPTVESPATCEAFRCNNIAVRDGFCADHAAKNLDPIVAPRIAGLPNQRVETCAWCGIELAPGCGVYNADGCVCRDRQPCRDRQRARIASKIAYEHAVPTPITPIVKNGTYTVVLNERGDYRTLKIEDCPEKFNKPVGTQIASYLSGSDNERDFTGCAFIAGDQVGMWARFKADSISAQALRVLVSATEDRRADYGTAYAIESGRCCRCGRKLTVPASLHRGMGPDCASK